MDNQPHNSIIFNVSGCLKEWIIREYLAGTLPQDMVRQIEMHLSDCPLCSDAVEGYMAIPAGKDVNSILEKTKEQLFGANKEQKLSVLKSSGSQKKRTNRIIYLSLAASVVLLIGCYFVFRILVVNNSENKIAQFEKTAEVKKGQKSPAIAEQADSISNPVIASGKSTNLVTEDQEASGKAGWHTEETNFEKSIGGDNDGTVPAFKGDFSESAQKVYTDLVTSDTVQTRFSDKVAEMEEKSKDQKDEVNGIVVNDAVAVETVSKTLENQSLKGVKSENKRATKKEAVIPSAGAVAQAQGNAGPAKQPLRDEINTGVDDYKKGDYPEAIGGLEKALQESPQDDQALYYCGMAYYNNHQNEKALQNLEKILKKKGSQYYEAAKWQTALIYRETNQKSKAKKVLNEIIDENGTYKQNAIDAVNELNK